MALAFASFACWLDRSGGAIPQPLAILEAWAEEAGLASPQGRPLRFVRASPRKTPALDYERDVVEGGRIGVRPDSLHDFMNVLAWLAFPRTKWALSQLHVAMAAAGDLARGRGAPRDAATLLDEHGAVVVVGDPDLLEPWRRRAWRDLFGVRRADVLRTMRLVVVGHGLLAKLGRPYPALTAHCLPLIAPGLGCSVTDARTFARAVDERCAAWLTIRAERFGPGDLWPLPLAGWPAFDPGRQADLTDPKVFRHPRERALS